MQITTAELITSRPEPRIGEVKLPVSVGIEYNAALQRIVREIKRDIDDQLVPVLRDEQRNYTADNTVIDDVTLEYVLMTPRLYNGYIADADNLYVSDSEVVRYAATRNYTVDSWFDRISVVLDRIRNKWQSAEFASIATQIASKFVTTVDGRVSKNFGMDVYGNDEDLQTIINMSIYDNVRLIKTIPEQYLLQVESIVVTNTRVGNRSSAMVKALSEQFGVRERHAKFIARDQTAKVNSAIAQKRMESAGYEYFQWRTSRDSRVRDRHTAIANKMTEYGKGVYRFDNPPLSDKGVPILPGTDYQCRCTMRPVSRREVEQNQESGNTAKGVKR